MLQRGVKSQTEDSICVIRTEEPRSPQKKNTHWFALLPLIAFNSLFHFRRRSLICSSGQSKRINLSILSSPLVPVSRRRTMIANPRDPIVFSSPHSSILREFNKFHYHGLEFDT